MYGHHTWQDYGSTGYGCQSCSWPAERVKIFFPCLRSRLRIWSHETGCSAVPSRVSLLISILRLNLVLTDGIPPEFRGGVHLFFSNRHMPSSLSAPELIGSCNFVPRTLNFFHSGSGTTRRSVSTRVIK